MKLVVVNVWVRITQVAANKGFGDIIMSGLLYGFKA